MAPSGYNLEQGSLHRPPGAKLTYQRAACSVTVRDLASSILVAVFTDFVPDERARCGPAYRTQGSAHNRIACNAAKHGACARTNLRTTGIRTASA